MHTQYMYILLISMWEEDLEEIYACQLRYMQNICAPSFSTIKVLTDTETGSGAGLVT